jgi:hypothetical protein
VIIDNAIYSFAFQLDNGIPIIPFYDDKEDKILPRITEYLMELKDLDDVRTINRKTFSLQELYELDVPSFLKYYYDDEKSPNNEEGFDSDIGEEEHKEVINEEIIDSPRTQLLKRRSCSFIITPTEMKQPKMGKKAQAAVDEELMKFQQTMLMYTANQQQDNPPNEPKP